MQQLIKEINQFDIYYQYTDDSKAYRYWNREAERLRSEIDKLTDQERKEMRLKLIDYKAEYFKL